MSLDTANATCDLCFAVVPRALMHFHRTWHDDRENASPRLFELGEIDRTLDELLTTVAQLKTIPQAQARQAFVAELRDRLIAEALDAATQELDDAPRADAHVPYLRQVPQPEEVDSSSSTRVTVREPVVQDGPS